MIDTNIIIDFLLTREPFYQASSEVMTKCANRELTGYIAFHSIPNLWYMLRKIPDDKRREWLFDICRFLRVTGASHEEVIKAINMKEFQDFEDCLQDRCAKEIDAQYIITRNVDYEPVRTIPSALEMGEVYQRLITDTLTTQEDYVNGIIRVYNDSICDVIDHYNCSVYYEPSYVVARVYQAGGF